MATSGSTDYTLTRNQVIQAALSKVVGDQNSISQDDYKLGARSLNLIVKSLHSKVGVCLWKFEQVIKKFSQSTEKIGTDTLNYRCRKSHTSSTDNKPITGDEWRAFWIQEGADGVDDWAAAQSYTSVGDFTLDSDVFDIDKAMLMVDDVEYELDIIRRDQYMDLWDKAVIGTPGRIMFVKYPTPTVFVHPQPDYSQNNLLILDCVKKLDDMDDAANELDMMQHWHEALVYLLASNLADDYGLNLHERSFLRARARELVNDAQQTNRDGTTLDLVDGYFDYEDDY